MASHPPLDGAGPPGAGIPDAPHRHTAPFPLWEVAVAVLAVVAVVGLLVIVLFQRTSGPGERLRDFYEAVDAGSCEEAYAFLSPAAAQRTDRETFCAVAQTLDVDPGFTVERLTLTGDPGREATVTVRDGGDDARSVVTWRFVLSGGDWKVDGIACPDDSPFAPVLGIEPRPGDCPGGGQGT